MDGPESLSSKSRGSRGSALGSGSLKKEMKKSRYTRSVTIIRLFTVSQTPACNHTNTHPSFAMCTDYRNVINLCEMQSASIKLCFK